MSSSSLVIFFFFFFSSRRRHTRCSRDWSSDVCSSDLQGGVGAELEGGSLDLVGVELRGREQEGVSADARRRLVEEEGRGQQGRARQRSEERRVGKECRSRWSP